MQLVLDTTGLHVSKRNNCFHIKSKKQSRMISPRRITSIAVVTDCSFTTAALLLAVKNEIPVLFFSRTGKENARIWSPYFGSISTLRRKQLAFYCRPEAAAWCGMLLKLRGNGQISNLDKLHREGRLSSERYFEVKEGIRKILESVVDLGSSSNMKFAGRLMGLEGTVSRRYWEGLVTAFGKEYGFAGRSRRPAKDRFNALLNYWFGMLYSKVEGAILSVGLDPYMGFLHAGEYQKPSLAFDMIEPFRPWAEELLIDVCLNRGLDTGYFDLEEEGCSLNREGKREFIPLFNGWMEDRCRFLGKVKTRKNHLLAFAGELAKLIDRTIDEDDIFDILRHRERQAEEEDSR